MAALTVASPLWAHGNPGDASRASSALSALPVALSVGAPIAIVAGGASLSVVAVEASAEGTVWVLERASDGMRSSLRFAGVAAGEFSVAVGTVIAVTAMSTGWVLSTAGQAICFVPNAVGVALLYHERLSR